MEEGDGEMISCNIESQIRLLARQAKRTSNIVTLVLLVVSAYTFHQWPSAMGIDRLINAFILLLIMVINIRLYLIYANLSDMVKIENLQLKRRYRQYKKEYRQLARLSLGMSMVLIVIKLIVH